MLKIECDTTKVENCEREYCLTGGNWVETLVITTKLPLTQEQIQTFDEFAKLIQSFHVRARNLWDDMSIMTKNGYNPSTLIEDQ